MKNIRIKTEKVTFYVIDMPEEVQNIYLNGISWQSRDGHWDTWYSEDESETLTFVSFLKDINEEQASGIADNFKMGYKNYTYRNPTLGGQQVAMIIPDYYRNSIDSLLSLMDSKGCHLYENPLKNTFGIQSLEGSKKHVEQIEQASLKTFYNPAIYLVKND